MENLSWTNLQLLFIPLLKAFLIIIVGHFFIKFLIRPVRKSLHKTKMDDLLVDPICRLANGLLHLVVILSALNAVGVSTTGFIAALSAAAAAVALALKDSLSNIAGGLVLLTSHRFTAGDYVCVNGEEGRVIDVGLMCTTILTHDKRRVSLPNGVLANSQIVNLTGESFRRVDTEFPVAYGADLEAAKKAAEEILLDCPNTTYDDEHKPMVAVKKYDDSAVILETWSWCQPGEYWHVYFDVRDRLLSGMAEKGFKVPFSRLEVDICTHDT